MHSLDLRALRFLYRVHLASAPPAGAQPGQERLDRGGEVVLGLRSGPVDRVDRVAEPARGGEDGPG
ncbi:hypothetical protein [Actinosynnema sp. NPDC020468]|uniref:hypothetical protein n=1 Tax=Actinosynnema sp. NPDC020468 TaxID=3154488 RepID=UPI0033E11D40